MKKIFPGYYRPTEEEFSNLWNSCLFVLDANVLLNLYRYSQETSDEFIQILKQISDRLWVPHQAALEYQKNRLQTIAKQLEVYDEIQKLVEDNKKKLKNKLDSLSKHPYIKANNLMKIMQKACTAIDKNLKKLKQGHPDLLQNDNLRDTLGTLLEDKIGLLYSQKKLDVVYNLGKKRYEQEIPPGYGDKNKEGVRKYGDLILWFQIIDKAKKTNKPIILVTDDRKEDWWRRFKNKTIGPRPELVNEIFSEAGVSFYLYQTDPFMENAQKLLEKQVKVNKKAIDEVREIRERDEERERFIKEATMASFKLSDDTLRAIDNMRASFKLSDDTLNVLQATKILLPILKKYIEKAEDSNLYTDSEPKEIGENEKDCQKKNEVLKYT
ncbi:MAG: DUF4935 domain-containing protein [Candidatus Atribacteria bacterium]